MSWVIQVYNIQKSSQLLSVWSISANIQCVFWTNLTTLLRQIKMKMRKQRPGPISMQRHSETCSQHYTIEFEVRQIPSSEIIERDRFLHVFWNVD